MKTYLWHIFVGLTQLLCTIVGGWPDETTSSYAWRLEQQGKLGGRIFRPLIDRLFWWQADHCMQAYEAERSRYQYPPILR